MGLFSKILDKLGIKKPASTTTTTTTTTPKISFPTTKGSGDYAKAAAIPVVDVVSKLEAMAKTNPEKLNWKSSIVDLLKLLDLDSSLTARKELATELGCPANLIGGDYSQMNIWLHKTVLQKIAENGGNIPASLLK